MLGESSEVEVFAALHRAGYVGLIAPFTDNARYDCVIDDGAVLHRVQIKTGYVGDGAIRWATRSAGGGRTPTYRGDAELFAVWVPELKSCYLVPVAECGRREAFLRLVPARNNQKKRTREAAPFMLRSARS